MPPPPTTTFNTKSHRSISLLPSSARRREILHVLIIAALTTALIWRAPRNAAVLVNERKPTQYQQKVTVARVHKKREEIDTSKLQQQTTTKSTLKTALYNNQRRHHHMNKRKQNSTTNAVKQQEQQESVAIPTTTTTPSSCHLLNKRRSLPNFYVHIPKVAGNSAHKLITDDFIDVCGPHTVNVCNHYTEQADQNVHVHSQSTFWQQWMRSNHNCSLHMSESPYIDSAQHAYTMIRDPTHHVVSQYFHCKESVWRKPTYVNLPELDEWLEYWNDQRAQDTAHLTNSSYPLLYTFDCYKPINLQTYMVGGVVTNLTTRFDVIGIMSRLPTTTCLISIQLLGVVPPRCDCSSTTNTTTRSSNLPKIDHGTKHHGDSFELTEYQQKLISSLTDQDMQLYEIAQQYFQQRVNEVEQEYKITLC